MWYPFEELHRLHMSELKIPRGSCSRFRKRSRKAPETKTDSSSTIKASVRSKDKRGREGDLDEDERAAKRLIQLRDFLEDLEELMPSAGRIFKLRLHQFLNQSLMQEVYSTE